MANKKSNEAEVKTLDALKAKVATSNTVSNPATAEAKPKKKLLKKKSSKKAQDIEFIDATKADITVTPTKKGAKIEVKNLEGKKNKKEKAIKETAKAQAVDLIEKVVSNREVKWIYPEDCTGSLERKSWRQKQRNKIHKMERELARIQDQNSKEYKAKLKELKDFQKEVLKAAV